MWENAEPLTGFDVDSAPLGVRESARRISRFGESLDRGDEKENAGALLDEDALAAFVPRPPDEPPPPEPAEPYPPHSPGSGSISGSGSTVEEGEVGSPKRWANYGTDLFDSFRLPVYDVVHKRRLEPSKDVFSSSMDAGGRGAPSQLAPAPVSSNKPDPRTQEGRRRLWQQLTGGGGGGHEQHEQQQHGQRHDQHNQHFYQQQQQHEHYQQGHYPQQDYYRHQSYPRPRPHPHPHHDPSSSYEFQHLAPFVDTHQGQGQSQYSQDHHHNHNHHQHRNDYRNGYSHTRLSRGPPIGAPTGPRAMLDAQGEHGEDMGMDVEMEMDVEE